MTNPAAILGCPPAQVTTEPLGDVLGHQLIVAHAHGRVVLGVGGADSVRWAAEAVPAPLQLIRTVAQVTYHQMWSGVMVQLPCTTPDDDLHLWLCDGELQVLRLVVPRQGPLLLQLL